MIKIKAYIELLKNARKTPFQSGYRPLFLFQEGTYTSGSIELLDRNVFYPEESALVHILFIERRFLGPYFRVGAKFIFCESPKAIMGEGIVQEIINEDSIPNKDLIVEV